MPIPFLFLYWKEKPKILKVNEKFVISFKLFIISNFFIILTY